MTSKLMNTEPGGEQTQYESIKTVTEPHAKSEGQLGDIENPSNEAKDQQAAEMKKRGEQTAENIRYGQTLSEQGFGGKTTDSDGTANQGGYGGQDLQDTEQSAARTRREQGYGPGSGVGA